MKFTQLQRGFIYIGYIKSRIDVYPESLEVSYGDPRPEQNMSRHDDGLMTSQPKSIISVSHLRPRLISESSESLLSSTAVNNSVL